MCKPEMQLHIWLQYIGIDIQDMNPMNYLKTIKVTFCTAVVFLLHSQRNTTLDFQQYKVPFHIDKFNTLISQNFAQVPRLVVDTLYLCLTGKNFFRVLVTALFE